MPKGKKKRVSLIAAIGVEERLSDHGFIHPDSVNKEAFKVFLEHVLLPKLNPESILVMDNWTVHHGNDIKALVEGFDCKILYLPRYSPDFNPIEYLFSKIKGFIRKLQADTLGALMQAFSDACQTVTLADVRGAFRHCGYLEQ